jgi:hypothetical protein
MRCWNWRSCDADSRLIGLRYTDNFAGGTRYREHWNATSIRHHRISSDAECDGVLVFCIWQKAKEIKAIREHLFL